MTKASNTSNRNLEHIENDIIILKQIKSTLTKEEYIRRMEELETERVKYLLQNTIKNNDIELVGSINIQNLFPEWENQIENMSSSSSSGSSVSGISGGEGGIGCGTDKNTIHTNNNLFTQKIIKYSSYGLIGLGVTLLFMSYNKYKR
jgi:hypothetical protein